MRPQWYLRQQVALHLKIRSLRERLFAALRAAEKQEAGGE